MIRPPIGASAGGGPAPRRPAARTSISAPSAGAPRLEAPQGGERLRAPGEHRAAAVLTVMKGRERKRKLRVARHLLDELSLDTQVCLEELLLPGLIVLDLGHAVGHGPGDAQEELEQELTANGLVPRREGEPTSELGAPLVGERVDVAVGLAALFLAPALGEALGGQPVQDRVDLAVALVPEMRDRALDELLHVVAGHRAEAQHAEDRVPARVRST